MSIARKIADILKNKPRIKRYAKNLYSVLGNFLSDKKTYPDSIHAVSDEKMESLFGYYDKCPWNFSGDKILYLQVQSSQKNLVSKKPASIILKNLKSGEKEKIGESSSWNTQQGCMLQWMGPDFESKVFYNNYVNGKFIGLIKNIFSGQSRIISSPLYSISKDGCIGITLDFKRLNTFRPGYGYSNEIDETKDIYCPDTPCLWLVELENNTKTSLLTYKDLMNIRTKPTMEGAYHKVNHVMLNPSGNRFMFLHRWIKHSVKYDRLFTCDIDGGNLRLLLDEDMVSHSNWRDDNTIITFARTEEHKESYYLLKDSEENQISPLLNMPHIDGHPSFSYDGKYILTDTYPDFKRKQHLYLCDKDGNNCREIASIYSRLKYKNESRCDLHPRWNYDSDKICFDGAQGKLRQVYIYSLDSTELNRLD